MEKMFEGKYSNCAFLMDENINYICLLRFRDSGAFLLTFWMFSKNKLRQFMI